MASYNAYLKTFAISMETFSAELQGIQFFSEHLGAVAEMGSDFAWRVKERCYWQIAV